MPGKSSNAYPPEMDKGNRAFYEAAFERDFLTLKRERIPGFLRRSDGKTISRWGFHSSATEVLFITQFPICDRR